MKSLACSTNWRPVLPDLRASCRKLHGKGEKVEKSAEKFAIYLKKSAEKFCRVKNNS
jgi:hypothetical protein